jgi:hypothetical protein
MKAGHQSQARALIRALLEQILGDLRAEIWSEAG